MPAQRTFLKRGHLLKAPDVVACHIDVLPPERRDVRQAFWRNRGTFVRQHLDGLLQVNGIPEDDRRNGEIKSARLIMVLTKAISDSTTATKERARVLG
jgi:hypothetical protein